MMPVEHAAIICRVDCAIMREIGTATEMSYVALHNGNAAESVRQHDCAMSMSRLLGKLQLRQFGDDLGEMRNL